MGLAQREEEHDILWGQVWVLTGEKAQEKIA